MLRRQRRATTLPQDPLAGGFVRYLAWSMRAYRLGHVGELGALTRMLAAKGTEPAEKGTEP